MQLSKVLYNHFNIFLCHFIHYIYKNIMHKKIVQVDYLPLTRRAPTICPPEFRHKNKEWKWVKRDL